MTAGDLSDEHPGDGPFRVIQWSRRWSLENVLDPELRQPRFASREEAAAEAERLNVAWTARRTPRVRPSIPVQGRLFGAGGDR